MVKHEMVAYLEERVRKYRGDVGELEHAIGAYFIGRLCGWTTLAVLHDPATIAKFERLLGFEMREPHLPTRSAYPPASVAWMTELGVDAFWTAVLSEIGRR